MSEHKHYVTLAELDQKLDKMPTRWEMRFLIVVGFFGSQFVPLNEVAKAATSIFF